MHVPNRGRLEHTGISIELIGVLIDFTNGANAIEFLHETKQLEKPGTIMGKRVVICIIYVNHRVLSFHLRILQRSMNLTMELMSVLVIISVLWQHGQWVLILLKRKNYGLSRKRSSQPAIRISKWK